MAIRADATVNWLMEHCRNQMGESYREISIAPVLTARTRLMALIWNEKRIQTDYNMEDQGGRVSSKFEATLIGQRRRAVGRAQEELITILETQRRHIIIDFPTDPMGLTYFQYIPTTARPKYVIEKAVVQDYDMAYDPSLDAWRASVGVMIDIGNMTEITRAQWTQDGEWSEPFRFAEGEGEVGGGV